MTIFGRNDTNTEGMTLIRKPSNWVRKGHWRPSVKVGEGHGYTIEKLKTEHTTLGRLNMLSFSCLLNNFIFKGTKLIKKTFKVSQEIQKEKAERT